MHKWLEGMEDEDLQFIKRFMLSSGSLKDLAEHYGVTYPTIRLRLDRLIQKIRIWDGAEPADDGYILFIKSKVLDGEIDTRVAKMLIQEYRREKEA
ncbi:MAG TPA: hypothetical protein DCM14_05725 [Clostridiales bacterium UBA8153]|nr:hypothetical protein [Clostridiales bacterium UBA8153]